MAVAMAVIRPEHAWRGTDPRKSTLLKNTFSVLLVISAPSRDPARKFTVENGIGRSGNLKFRHLVAKL